MRIVVFGATGATGRLVVDQALAAGHRVVAAARRPDLIPVRDGLSAVAADVMTAADVDAAVAGSDAVLSAVGVSYSPKTISVYSTGATNIVAAMRRHEVKRLVVAGSTAIDPTYQPSDSFVYMRVVEPWFMRRPGRTLYEDNARMETVVQQSGLEWTIVRSCWLFSSNGVTDYQVTDRVGVGMYTARSDLAACLLAQLPDDRNVGKIVAVTTTTGIPTLPRQIWRESIKGA